VRAGRRGALERDRSGDGAAPRSPIYLQIAGELRTAIEDGFYAAGSVMPSERLLAKRLCVSRDTVRDALRVLVGEGLVLRRPDGHLVSPEPVHEPVIVPPDAVVTARMPTPKEHKRLGMDRGAAVPVLVVQVAGRPDAVYAANGAGLHFGDPTPEQPS
jgi:DNA-binding transcriptional MocR family regulator